jgi:FixJ family two-component response regulator
VTEAWHSRLMYMEGSCYLALANAEGSCCVVVADVVSPKREGRELERELCRNTETTRHGERTDPNRI